MINEPKPVADVDQRRKIERESRDYWRSLDEVTSGLASGRTPGSDKPPQLTAAKITDKNQNQGGETTMPMEHKYLAPSLRQFLEENPSLFMRCDADGKENQKGDFWNVREDFTEQQGVIAVRKQGR